MMTVCACTHSAADFTCSDRRGRQYGACCACRASLTRSNDQGQWHPCSRTQTLRVALVADRVVVDRVTLHRCMAALAGMCQRPPRAATPTQREAYLERYEWLTHVIDAARSGDIGTSAWGARLRLMKVAAA